MVECVLEVCKEVGVKCVLLFVVSVLFYCELMKLVVEKLVVDLVVLIFNIFKCDVINNVDVKVE